MTSVSEKDFRELRRLTIGMQARPPLLPAVWSAAREATDSGVDVVIDDDVRLKPTKKNIQNKPDC